MNQTMQDVIHTALKDRINGAYAEMLRALNADLYGDGPGFKSKPMSRWGRVKSRIWLYRERVSDAWLVLTGRADIGY